MSKKTKERKTEQSIFEKTNSDRNQELYSSVKLK